jgi:N-acetylglucosamine kinase-like BadF-type ATPase
LTQCLLDQLHVSQPYDLPARVGDLDRGQLAALAPHVLGLAESRDSVAVVLVEQAADDLAGLVNCLARRMRWSGGEFPLALSGGLLLNHPQFVSLLQTRLKRRRMAPATLQLVPDPVQGALLLASR